MSVRNCFIRGSVIRYVQVSRPDSLWHKGEGGGGVLPVFGTGRAPRFGTDGCLRRRPLHDISRHADAAGCRLAQRAAWTRAHRRARRDTCVPPDAPAFLTRLFLSAHIRSLSYFPAPAPAAAAALRASSSYQLPPGSVDVEILHDATRREAKGG